MDSNKNLFTKIISIAALVILGYIFFISVYNQIIVQSGGLFYVIIFGGILILAFVLLSLVTKLIEITGEIKDNFMWNFVEILLLCNLAYLFFAFRLAYRSTVPPEEAIIYRAAMLMRTGELADKGMDMFRNLIIYPASYAYATVLSWFLRISDDGSKSMIILNAIMLTLNAFFIDRVVRKIAGRACGVIAALCTFFIPSQSFAVYSYSAEPFFCLILLITVDLFLVVLGMEESDDSKMIGFSALLGASTAFLCYVEPLMILCVILFAVYFVMRRKENGSSSVKSAAVITGVAVILFVVLIFMKSMALSTNLGDVLSGSMSRFKLSRNIETDEKYTFKEIFGNFHDNLDNQDTNVSDNYHFLVNEDGEEYTKTHNAWFSLGTQMSYMFVIVMSIACSFYMFKNRGREAEPGFILLIGSFLVLFFRSSDESSTYFMFEILIIMAGCGLYYMYMNHHPELNSALNGRTDEAIANTIADRDVSEWGAIARARALIFANNGSREGQRAVTDEAMTQTGVVNANPAVPVQSNDQTEGIVSPEGYFSFFSLGGQNVRPAPAPAAPVYQETVSQNIVPSNENIRENADGSLNGQSSEEYAAVSEEYIEPVQEIAETAEEFEEPAYEESVSEYTGAYETATEYAEPEYVDPGQESTETAAEYTEPYGEYEETAVEYTEPAEDYAETVTEYTEPAEDYAETVTEYIEPAEDYAETVTEYIEPAEDYAETVTEYTEPEAYNEETASEYAQSEYEEPVYDETAADYSDTAAEYNEPAYSDTSGGGNGTRTSYGNAAHALGFSLGEDFFADAADDPKPDAAVYEENGYAEPVTEYQESQTEYTGSQIKEPAYESAGVEEPTFDIFGNEIPYEETIQQTATDDAHKPYYASEDEDIKRSKEPDYEFAVNYDENVDEFSFGESMPDVFENEIPDQPAEDNALRKDDMLSYDTLDEAPRKKVIKKKIVRRVVKKVPAAGQVNEQQDFSINAKLRQGNDLKNAASQYVKGTEDPSDYYDRAYASMPSLVQENLSELALANVPVSVDEPDISDIVFDEADSRYNMDDFDDDWDDGDEGDGSGYVIEI